MEAWYTTALDIEEGGSFWCLLILIFILFVADVIKSLLKLLIGGFLTLF